VQKQAKTKYGNTNARASVIDNFAHCFHSSNMQQKYAQQRQRKGHGLDGNVGNCIVRELQAGSVFRKSNCSSQVFFGTLIVQC